MLGNAGNIGEKATPRAQPTGASGSASVLTQLNSTKPPSEASLVVSTAELAAPEPSGESESSQAESSAAVQALPLPQYLEAVVDPLGGQKSMSEQFANMQPWKCRLELRRRRIAVQAAKLPAPGVATPLRLAGNLGPIRFVTPGSKSVYGILDCRLALLLSELAPTLSTLSVKEVYVDNFYRPRAHLPGKKALSQHAFGLAIDIAGFGMTDGTRLNIERDFQGALGAPVCGSEALLFEATRESILLRNIVCKLARIGAFNYFLTPNYDAAHHNHLHGDIKSKTHDHVVR
jgi:hypothetical protein